MMQGEVQLQPFDSQKLGDSAPLLENSPSSSSSSAAGSSNEINAVDLESGSASAPCCRICLENDSDLLGDELISPCMCKGTHQFVHRSCLDHWRSVKEGFAFSHCTTCNAQFHLRVEPFEDSNSWRRKAKFRLFVARDVLLVFFAVQTVIAVMAGCAYMMDKDGEFRNSFNHDWDRILSKHPISFYYCIGVVTFFVLIGLIGLILHCSSLNDNDPRMAGSDPRMAGSDPRMAGSDPKMAGSDPRMAGSDPRMAGSDPRMAGSDPRMAGSDPRMAGSDPKMAGSDPRMAGSDPRMAGSDPRMAGSDPKMAGSDPRMAGSQNCSYGSHNLGYFPASEELCVALVVVFVVIFAILGLAYGFLAATMAIQRIWQRHYHILTKRGLTKEYIVEDLHGCYTPPKLDAEHEGILKMLKLM